MAIHDYRLNPFLGVFEVKTIYNERHTVPTKSPYTIRLNEVPQKTDPTTLIVTYEGGGALTEVAAQPTQGQYWPDYNTTEHGIADWNTGTLLFSAADAGKVVLINYNGLGTLTDDRLLNMVEIEVTSSTQPEREAVVAEVTSYDSTMSSDPGGDFGTYRGRIRTHKGIPAGKYTLQQIVQHIINTNHTHEYVRDHYTFDCNCDCDCGDTDS